MAQNNTKLKLYPRPGKCAPVEYKKVVHGRWDDSGRYHFVGGGVAVCCTICGCALSPEEYEKFHWNYCPVCGAKMDGRKNATDKMP